MISFNDPTEQSGPKSGLTFAKIQKLHALFKKEHDEQQALYDACDHDFVQHPLQHWAVYCPKCGWAEAKTPFD